MLSNDDNAQNIFLFSVIGSIFFFFYLFYCMIFFLYESKAVPTINEDMSSFMLTSNSEPMKVTVLFRHADSKEPGSSSIGDKVYLYIYKLCISNIAFSNFLL